MRPYGRQLGGYLPKLSTQYHAGRYPTEMLGIKTVASIVDKTQYCESRPKAKDTIRQAKRSFNKRTRHLLKCDLYEEINENSG